MVLIAVRSRPVAAKCRRTFWTVVGLVSMRLISMAFVLLTEIDSRPAFRRDHHVFDFMKRKPLAWHSVHGIVKHLAGGISIFNLIS